MPDSVTTAAGATSGNYSLVEGRGGKGQTETKYLSWLSVSARKRKGVLQGAISCKKEKKSEETKIYRCLAKGIPN